MGNGRRKTAGVAAIAAAGALVVLAAGCGGGSGSERSAAATTGASVTQATDVPSADLGAIKGYLLDQTAQLTGFTTQFKQGATRYYDLAKAANFDYAALWSDQAEVVGPLLAKDEEGLDRR